MQDLYLVFEDNKAIKCAFNTIVIRNESLIEKYPGGTKAFVEKHTPKCNKDLTVSCHMGSDVEDVWNDLIQNGLVKNIDFTSFDTVSYSFEFRMSGKEDAIHDIVFDVSWLKGHYTKDGVFVWYETTKGKKTKKSLRLNTQKVLS